MSRKITLIVITIVFITACSTQKNTPRSRWWHSFNARYNTYFNGAQAYIDGSLEKEKGNVDNFTELIPLYTVGNKKSREIGRSNFDRAIEKSEKAIKRHSIKKKPEWNKNRRKTERDIEWLNRKEYNPFLWKAWMLMGRSQFHKGSFDEAAATFSYMSRLYQTQPAIYGKARAWLAKCYIEQEWIYDAEDVIRNMLRDSIDWRAQKEWDYTFADYYIHTGEYDKAIPYLKKVIKKELRRVQRAREYYLLGQLYAKLGQRENAYKAFRDVLRQTPPYIIEFNARIAMAEVSAERNSKKMISTLRNMARNDKNKEYLDQVYYAIGNIYLLQNDTIKAIEAFEKGNEKATRNGIEKGVLLLRLGDIYWDKEMFGDAQRCYGAAIGLLDRERTDYNQLSERSKKLDELVPHTNAIHLQDSLQRLANMSEEDRNAVIDKIIDDLKKKEKEERRAAQIEDAEQQKQKNSAVGNRNQTTQQVNRGQQQSNVWYFYNPMAVISGKTAFEKQWGSRENVDDWQRINKSVVGDLSDNNEQKESEIEQENVENEAEDDEMSEENDAKSDPHRREYYIERLPLTEEKLAASNQIIKEALFHSGMIFKDKFDNLPLSYKQFNRLMTSFPNFENMDEVYYHMFLLHSRLGEHVSASNYVDRLKSEFSNSNWTKVLTDPYYMENAQFGIQLEDSLYAATYEAFKSERFAEVAGNAYISESRFPMGANREKFMFISGLSLLNSGDARGCIKNMEQIVSKYPNSRIGELAGMIINGVRSGRKLQGGKFDISDIWDIRSEVLNEEDSIANDLFMPDRNTPHRFLLVYNPAKTDENQLLYEMARFNFTNYLVRNFDISIEEQDSIGRMFITGFQSFDEAHLYARHLYENKNIVGKLKNTRGIVISEVNFPLLGTKYSYQDYEKFYNKHFAPLVVSNPYLLTEPAEISIQCDREPEPIEPEKEEEQLEDELLQTEVYSIEEEKPIENINETIEIAAEKDTISTVKDEEIAEETIVLPQEPEIIETQEEDGFVIEEEETSAEDDEDGFVFDDNTTTTTTTEDDEFIIIDNSNTKKNTTEDFDVDDEYYELDGF